MGKWQIHVGNNNLRCTYPTNRGARDSLGRPCINTLPLGIHSMPLSGTEWWARSVVLNSGSASSFQRICLAWGGAIWTSWGRGKCQGRGGAGQRQGWAHAAPSHSLHLVANVVVRWVRLRAAAQVSGDPGLPPTKSCLLHPGPCMPGWGPSGRKRLRTPRLHEPLVWPSMAALILLLYILKIRASECLSVF